MVKNITHVSRYTQVQPRDDGGSDHTCGGQHTYCAGGHVITGGVNFYIQGMDNISTLTQITKYIPYVPV